MDFITIAKQRMSVRDYKETKVEPEKLEQILEAAHVAPTAANLQPIRLIAVQSEEGLAKISKAANIYGAPLAIIVCADHDKAWVRPFDQKQTGDIDASILTDHMMLQATELGLGTVWVYGNLKGYVQGSLWTAHWNLYESVPHETGRCSASSDAGNHSRNCQPGWI